jgi:hypothetical protein
MAGQRLQQRGKCSGPSGPLGTMTNRRHGLVQVPLATRSKTGTTVVTQPRSPMTSAAASSRYALSQHSSCFHEGEALSASAGIAWTAARKASSSRTRSSARVTLDPSAGTVAPRPPDHHIDDRHREGEHASKAAAP